MSFHHPGLLHAILAIGSLQISKLQNTPATAAMKHYHLSIRRIAKNLKSPTRRSQPATLAASLLLSYFEVWSSDHSKWCNHLFGARILFREIPLRQMSRQCLPIKRMRQIELATQLLHARQAASPSQPFPPQLSAIAGALDFELLSHIVGSPVLPEDYGLGPDTISGIPQIIPSEKDIEKYENLRDLFWWYCKMDVYQSMLGGTKLL